MNITPFTAERWMDEHHSGIRYNLNNTCPDALSVEALMKLCGVDGEAFAQRLLAKPLGYGSTKGHPALRHQLAGLYSSLTAEDILTAHGAIGANHLVLAALTGPGDRVISIQPTYQQLYALSPAFGAEVSILPLRPEHAYLPDLQELAALAEEGVKLICINSPGNPTGALLEPELLEGIIAIARKARAWVLCDEAYRGLQADGGMVPSIADLYERGISVSSMSKGFSMPGLRLGWVASRDQAVMEACLNIHDYTTISCGVLDEMVATLALEHKELIWQRNIRHVRQNLTILRQWVEGRTDIRWVVPQAGTTALLHYDLQMDSRDLCLALLRDTGVYVIPGDCFEVPGSFRVGYACPPEELEQGLSILGTYLTQLAQG